MQMTRRGVLAGGAALLVAGTGRGEARVIGGPAFAGSWRAVLPGSAPAEAAEAAIAGVIAAIDAEMSPWRHDSVVSRFNRAGVGQALRPGLGFAAVLREALRVRDLTEGAFDPGVGPLVARFGFGPIRGDRTRAMPGGAYMLRDGVLRKSAPGLSFDPCGIAKGHAVDVALDRLAALGICDALVEIGGELRGSGRSPSGRDWQVAIERPGGAGWTAQRIVALRGRALASSGLAPNGQAGRGSLSHIIDPSRARPADPGLLAVSVLAGSAMRADALATGLAARGPVAGPQLARRLRVAALFLLRAPDGGIDEVMTAGFAGHVVA